MFEQGNEVDLNAAPPPAEESNNRTFIIAAGILAGVVFLSLACMAAYVLLILPKQKAQNAQVQATLDVQQTQMVQMLTQTAVVLQFTNTPLPTPKATNTNTPSPTPVIASPIVTPTESINPAEATYAALQTQAANAALTPTSTLVMTPLPTTGFADKVGLPGLVIMAIALVVVIFLARRLRSAPGK